jgi:MSHA pilin protein MshD
VSRPRGPKVPPRSGFALIEVLLALGILAVALPLVVGLFSGGAREPVLSRGETRALFLCQELLEGVLTRKWDEKTTPAGRVASPSVIGLDAGESAATRPAWDDIDDYDGVADTPVRDVAGALLPGFEGFSSRVDVDYVCADKSAPDFDIALAKNAGSDFKRVTVTVRWSDGSVSLTAVRGNF